MFGRAKDEDEARSGNGILCKYENSLSQTWLIYVEFVFVSNMHKNLYWGAEKQFWFQIDVHFQSEDNGFFLKHIFFFF